MRSSELNRWTTADLLLAQGHEISGYTYCASHSWAAEAVGLVKDDRALAWPVWWSRECGCCKLEASIGRPLEFAKAKGVR